MYSQKQDNDAIEKGIKAIEDFIGEINEIKHNYQDRKASKIIPADILLQAEFALSIALKRFPKLEMNKKSLDLYRDFFAAIEYLVALFPANYGKDQAETKIHTIYYFECLPFCQFLSAENLTITELQSLQLQFYTKLTETCSQFSIRLLWSPVSFWCLYNLYLYQHYGKSSSFPEINEVTLTRPHLIARQKKIENFLQVTLEKVTLGKETCNIDFILTKAYPALTTLKFLDYDSKAISKLSTAIEQSLKKIFLHEITCNTSLLDEISFWEKLIKWLERCLEFCVEHKQNDCYLNLVNSIKNRRKLTAEQDEKMKKLLKRLNPSDNTKINFSKSENYFKEYFKLSEQYKTLLQKNIKQQDYVENFQKKLLTPLIENIYATIGKPPCTFLLAAGGSIAHGNFYPLSDLDILPIIKLPENISSAECEKIGRYFKTFWELLHLDSHLLVTFKLDIENKTLVCQGHYIDSSFYDLTQPKRKQAEQNFLTPNTLAEWVKENLLNEIREGSVNNGYFSYLKLKPIYCYSTADLSSQNQNTDLNQFTADTIITEYYHTLYERLFPSLSIDLQQFIQKYAEYYLKNLTQEHLANEPIDIKEKYIKPFIIWCNLTQLSLNWSPISTSSNIPSFLQKIKNIGSISTVLSKQLHQAWEILTSLSWEAQQKIVVAKAAHNGSTHQNTLIKLREGILAWLPPESRLDYQDIRDFLLQPLFHSWETLIQAYETGQHLDPLSIFLKKEVSSITAHKAKRLATYLAKLGISSKQHCFYYLLLPETVRSAYYQALKQYRKTSPEVLLTLSMIDSPVLAERKRVWKESLLAGFSNAEGLTFSERGSHEEALKCYEKALQLNPKNYSFWYNKIASLYRLGRYAEALQAIDQTSELLLQNTDVMSYRKGLIFNTQELAGKALMLQPQSMVKFEIENDDEESEENKDEELPDYIYKVVVVGNKEARTTSVITRWVDPTLIDLKSLEFQNRSVRFAKKNINLQLWDTAGLWHFRGLFRLYFKEAVAALICFNMAQLNPFEGILKLANQTQEYRPNIPMLLIGTNRELIKVKEEFEKICQQSLEMTKKIGAIKFIACSAMEDIGFEEIEKCVIKNILLRDPRFICEKFLSIPLLNQSKSISPAKPGTFFRDSGSPNLDKFRKQKTAKEEEKCPSALP